MNQWQSFLITVGCAVLVAFTASVATGMLIAWLKWHLLEMPRFRRDYLIKMKREFPQDYADKYWPRRWQDRLYHRASRCRDDR